MKNVHVLSIERIEYLIKEFDQIYISFSGGKDSGVLLNLYLDLIEKHNPDIRPIIFYMDYEIQYQKTSAYVERTFTKLSQRAEIYHICVPFKVTTCTSMYQSYWRPWDNDKRELWVRELPKHCYTKDDFDFYHEDLWDYDFQFLFGEWLHRKNNAKKTCCLVGIRTQESYNRWRTIYSTKFATYKGKKWTSCMFEDIYNAYPIYDWKTTDIWTANGKFKWDYNHLYDLYYQAGVPLAKQRVASPFLCEARESLYLYKVIDPNTWGKMINRVNGVNFTAIYGGTHAMGRKKIVLPNGFTWKKYMYFLLDTLPEEAQLIYKQKLKVSISFWKNKGGALSEDTIKKLEARNIPMDIDKSYYNTQKRAVRMDYLDEIDIPEQREIPTYKRVCICILRNDYQCKYMGFAQTKDDRIRKMRVLIDYESLKSQLNG
ncbi:MAG: DUF3440 domain-containing protein [Bacteroides sp.]|uniref:DUF3440 domain-containing protein n=1 Tax=Bacteroides sp. TaxID=29523 RepID=UPI002FC9829A